MIAQQESLDLVIKRLTARNAVEDARVGVLGQYTEESLQFVVDELKKLISPDETLEVKKAVIAQELEPLSVEELKIKVGEVIESIRIKREVESSEVLATSLNNVLLRAITVIEYYLQRVKQDI